MAMTLTDIPGTVAKMRVLVEANRPDILAPFDEIADSISSVAPDLQLAYFFGVMTLFTESGIPVPTALDAPEWVKDMGQILEDGVK